MAGLLNLLIFMTCSRFVRFKLFYLMHCPIFGPPLLPVERRVILIRSGKLLPALPAPLRLNGVELVYPLLGSHPEFRHRFGVGVIQIFIKPPGFEAIHEGHDSLAIGRAICLPILLPKPLDEDLQHVP